MIMGGSKENTVTKADEKFNTPITALDQQKAMIENSDIQGVPIMEDGLKHFEGDVFAKIPLESWVNTRINIQPSIKDVPIKDIPIKDVPIEDVRIDVPTVALKDAIDWSAPVYSDTCSKPYHSNSYGIEIFTPQRVESIVDDYTSREECKYSVIKKQIEQEDPTMDTQFDRTKVKKEIHNCIAKILCLKSTYSLSDSTIEDIVIDVLEKMENNEEVLV